MRKLTEVKQELIPEVNGAKNGPAGVGANGAALMTRLVVNES